MVAGHLSVKNGKYYAVLNYKNAKGERKSKWVPLGLPEKGNKRKAEAELARLRAEFEVPEEVGDLSSDMLFSDYLLEWLEIARGRLAVATYGCYQGLLKNPIVPYFRKRKLKLRELEARHLQMFYSEQLKKVKPNHRHSLSRRHPLGTQVCGENRYADAECGGQGGQAEKEQLPAGVPLGGGNAADV